MLIFWIYGLSQRPILRIGGFFLRLKNGEYNPFSTIFLAIWSAAEFDGVQIRIFGLRDWLYWPKWDNLIYSHERIPTRVDVFPVPGGPWSKWIPDYFLLILVMH